MRLSVALTHPPKIWYIILRCRFPPVGPLPFTADEYRFLQVGSYVIFFRETGEVVYVDRVLNNKRDFASLLGCL